MRKETFDEIRIKVEEGSKFIKFGRKKIGVDIQKQLDSLEKEIIRILESPKRDTSKKLQLISDILSTKRVDNESFVRFRKLIQNDFMEFANSESSLKEEAQAVLQLQSIEKRIEILLNFSGIYDKNIIAIGGGFSAGKSEFISSFFKNSEMILPIGIKPVTAIPTYIIASTKNIIKGFAKQGGTITIAPSLYKELSHDFVKSFPFNLKDIMPAMSVETPLAYKNICFIDTPGYNPSDTSDGFTNEDIDTAKEYLEHANVLLWLVGLDSNGTISTSDLEFLEEISLENKDFFVIANKADLKSNDDIQDILDNFEETLDYADIEYAGISAYSSIDSEEIAFRKQSIYSFLDQQNTPIEAYSQIIKDLEDVFELYNNAINNDIEFAKSIRKNFKSLELDLLEKGFVKYDEGDNKISKRIYKMMKLFEAKDLEKHLNNLEKLKKKMLYEVSNIFNTNVKYKYTKSVKNRFNAKVSYKLNNDDSSSLVTVEYNIDRNVTVLNSKIIRICTRIGGVIGAKIGEITIGFLFGSHATVDGAAIGIVSGKVDGYIVGKVIAKVIKIVTSSVIYIEKIIVKVAKKVGRATCKHVKYFSNSVSSRVKSFFER